MKDEYAIKIEHLTKRYLLQSPQLGGNGELLHEFEALSDLNFNIQKGERIGVIGLNGSGKSTLLKILAGVSKPSNGEVSLRGKVGSILDIGAGFHPELSGRENVFLNGQIHGFSKKEIGLKYDEIVAFSGIQKFMNEPVKNYSNGMYLRLAFSLVVYLEFDIYLFDEVLSVGDDEFRQKVSNFFHHKLSKRNATIVLVSHNFQEIINFTDRTILLNQGKVVSTGTSSEMVQKLKQEIFKLKASKQQQSNAYFSAIDLKFMVNEAETYTASIEDTIHVQISLRKKTNDEVKLAFRVRDFLGNVVFVTSYDATLQSKILDKNDLVLIAEIPPFFFNKGTFNFDLIGVNSNNELLFSIVNAGELEINLGSFTEDYWLNNSFGPVRPFFNWKIQEI